MKQISMATAKRLATRDKDTLKREREFAAGDWIERNASQIAAIEMKTVDKTYCGAFPDGWRKAMKQEVDRIAPEALTGRFVARHCQTIDGVLWLADMKLIEELEGKR